MSTPELSERDKQIILFCIDAIIRNRFLEDWEFGSLIGRERHEAKLIIREWIESNQWDDETKLVINNCLNAAAIGNWYPHTKLRDAGIEVQEIDAIMDKL